ncbi:MAG: DedA family protein [Anaerolinea sp.]|nr:DedA family protein [Anaerolinea sp.]
MEIITYLIDLILHMDTHLAELITKYDTWTYLILFLVIFMETGLVVTPFLPGDSLLFAAGALAALDRSPLNVVLLWFLLFIAAIVGDTVNYSIGKFVGPKAFTSNSKLLKKEYLDRTHAFYQKHGGVTIFLARFIPIIRTFAPFVAGIGEMRYSYFISYNIIGGLVWTLLFIFLGYFFGNLPFVQDHFSLVVIAIIIISLIPAVWEAVKARRKPSESKAE